MICSRGKKRYASVTTAIYVIAAALLPTLAGQTWAAEDYKAPSQRLPDPVGVDIPSGLYLRDDTFLTIGDPSAGGLSWTYHGHYPGSAGDYRGYIGDACTNPPPIFSDPTCDPTDPSVLVWIGEGATTFEPATGGGYQNYSGTAATLTASGSNWLYTEGDGTAYTFTPSTPGNIFTATLKSIKHPNGMLITLNSGSAVANTGFALRFTATGVDAVNMLAHTCDAQALSCDAYDSSITLANVTDATMLGIGAALQITDSMGGQWRYKGGPKFSYLDKATQEPVRGGRVLFSFKDPTGYLVNMTRAERGGLTAFTDPRGTFVYGGQSATLPAYVAYINTTKDPAGNVIYSAGMNIPVGPPAYYKDGLNRQTSYGGVSYQWGTNMSGFPIGQYVRITSVTKPEGNSLSYVYDARGNVTQTTATPKAGMGSAYVAYSASYPTSCTYAATCNKPTWEKDAKGNQTDFTYDNNHGGVLTVTLPADNNGLRLRTYNTYTAFDTGNGIIYRLTSSETCGLTSAQLSLTACPADINTSMSVIDYGTATTAPYTYKSSLPYQTTKRDKRASGYDSQTTTYAYDQVGNVVSVDGPLAGTADQTITMYDALRRVVYEMSADPDGGNALPRVIIHHLYDADSREIRTETGWGYGSLVLACGVTATTCTNYTVTNYVQRTYDAAGRLIKSDTIVTGNAVP